MFVIRLAEKKPYGECDELTINSSNRRPCSLPGRLVLSKFNTHYSPLWRGVMVTHRRRVG